MKKEGSFLPLFLVMGISLMVGFFWDKIPAIKEVIHSGLDPTAGFLLDMNATFGMIVLVFVISLITTIVQKYATDQKTIRELREEQKLLRKEMDKYKDHPEKLAELSKKNFEFIPKTMKLTSRATMFTVVPFVLFFRWFNDYFTTNPVQFLGFLNWFIFYFILTMVFSGILRKVLNVV